MVLASLAAPLSAEEAPVRLQAGLWDRAITLGSNRREVTRVCFNDVDARAANGSAASVAAGVCARDAVNGCRTGAVAVDGPRIRSQMTCRGRETRSDIVYFGTRFTGTMTTEMTPNTWVAIGIEATRVGDCSPATRARPGNP